jgi:hypothetical protein
MMIPMDRPATGPGEDRGGDAVAERSGASARGVRARMAAGAEDRRGHEPPQGVWLPASEGAGDHKGTVEGGQHRPPRRDFDRPGAGAVPSPSSPPRRIEPGHATTRECPAGPVAASLSRHLDRHSPVRRGVSPKRRRRRPSYSAASRERMRAPSPHVGRRALQMVIRR